MKTLILMRHAKSDWIGGVPDHDRPLNPRGRKSAAALGDWLRSSGHLPDQALISDATRTRETWALLDLPVTAQFLPALYHASAAQMLDILKTATGNTVLMLGHNPDIAELANRLTDEPPADPDFDRYPTGATTILSFDIDAWSAIRTGTADLVAFQTPRPLLA